LKTWFGGGVICATGVAQQLADPVIGVPGQALLSVL